MTRRAAAVASATVFAAILALLALTFAYPSAAMAAEWAQPTVRFQATSELKDTGSLTTYPGKKTSLQLEVPMSAGIAITWKSTDKNVATVSKRGVVTAKNPGRCYIKATVAGITAKVLVEVTSKKAYQAVRNAFADKASKISYSQLNRMAKSCRDCSSFVSRCYWDASLGRKIFAIGGSAGKTWALPAADQAKWLKKKGKCVALKACAAKDLRPGDTLYFETDYAGKDATQWRYIDHAAIYVGNGYVMDTGGSGGKGSIGFRWCKYSAKDATIKFIGRPCP